MVTANGWAEMREAGRQGIVIGPTISARAEDPSPWDIVWRAGAYLFTRLFAVVFFLRATEVSIGLGFGASCGPISGGPNRAPIRARIGPDMSFPDLSGSPEIGPNWANYPEAIHSHFLIPEMSFPEVLIPEMSLPEHRKWAPESGPKCSAV